MGRKRREREQRGEDSNRMEVEWKEGEGAGELQGDR